MLRVPISMAKPGMTLSLPVYHPRRHDTVLLHQGMILDDRSIRRLREIHLRQLWIQYPGVEFVCEYICPSVFESQAALTWQIGRAIELVSQGAFARLEYGEYRSAIGAVLGRLIANPRAAVFIQEIVGRDQPVLRHASNVCLTSILMGLKLDDYLVQERSRLGAQSARDVSSLGVGAMLHDVGMLRLDPGVVQRWNLTLDDTDPEWRRHVQVGYELVKDAIGPSAAAGVLHHHQKFDGSGFPKRQLLSGLEEALSGSDIHVFARIIACADLFDRLRHPPGSESDAPPVPVVRVLNRLRSAPFCEWIDPMVYKALLAVIPAYAPGTMVTLSNGIQGVVTQWFADDPCRPTVQELGEIKRDNRSDVAPRRFVLKEEPDLAVAFSEGQDVGEDNFYPAIPGEFDLRLAGRALHNRAAGPLARST